VQYPLTNRIVVAIGLFGARVETSLSSILFPTIPASRGGSLVQDARWP